MDGTDLCDFDGARFWRPRCSLRRLGKREQKRPKVPVHAPDLTGVWANITEMGPTFNPKEDPSFQPWAEVKWKANKNDDPGQPSITNGRVDLDPTVASCFPTGMPRLMTEVFPFEIVQLRDRVLILFEKDYAVSHIWTDGRKLPDRPGSHLHGAIGWQMGWGHPCRRHDRSKRHHLARSGRPSSQ